MESAMLRREVDTTVKNHIKEISVIAIIENSSESVRSAFLSVTGSSFMDSGFNVEHIALHEIGHIFGLKDHYLVGLTEP